MSDNPFFPGDLDDLTGLAGVNQRHKLISQQAEQIKEQEIFNRGLQAKLAAIESQENERAAIERKRLQLEAARAEKETAERKQARAMRRLMADAIAQLDELRESLP